MIPDAVGVLETKFAEPRAPQDVYLPSAEIAICTVTDLPIAIDAVLPKVAVGARALNLASPPRRHPSLVLVSLLTAAQLPKPRKEEALMPVLLLEECFW